MDDKKEIYSAFIKAQAELNNPTRDTKSYKYSYAQLGQCLDIVRPIFAKHNLGIIQQIINKENDVDLIGIKTVIVHSSGQSIEFEFFVKAIKKGAQDIGSMITYMRRYALFGAVGIHPQDEDDDGLKAQTIKIETTPPSPKFTWGQFNGLRVADVPLESLRAEYETLKSRDNFNEGRKKFSVLFDAIEKRLGIENI